MVPIVIQKGRENNYIKNLNSSIVAPVDRKKVNQILLLLETNNLQNTKTYSYIKDNQNNLRIWSANTHDYGNLGFEDIKSSKNPIILFFIGEYAEYIGTVSQVNDIEDIKINSYLSKILWDNNKWTNIWFLTDIETVNKISRNEINIILEIDIFDQIFTRDPRDNLRRIDNVLARKYSSRNLLSRLVNSYATSVRVFNQLTDDQLKESINKHIEVAQIEIGIRNRIDEELYNRDKNYWNKGYMPEDLLNKVSDRSNQNLKSRKTRDTRNGYTILEYCDIMDYQTIIKGNWRIFQSIFDDKNELNRNFKYFNQYRILPAHNKTKITMDKTVMKNGKESIEWFSEKLNITLRTIKCLEFE